MYFKTITSTDELWCNVKDYAKSCSWRAGKALAKAMEQNVFEENLYEKYGFCVIERKVAPWGAEEKIYRKKLGES